MGPTEVTCVGPSMVTPLCHSPRRRSVTERERNAGNCSPHYPADTPAKTADTQELADLPIANFSPSAQKELSPASCRTQLSDASMQKMVTASEKAATTYASVTPVVLTEFVPSRKTRPSQNVALQEHVSDGRTVIQQRGLFGGPGRGRHRRPEPKPEALPGQYAQIDFARNTAKPNANNSPRLGRGSLNDLGSLMASDGSSSAGVFGLEKSCDYENLCRPRNNIQASVWLGQRFCQGSPGRDSPPSVPSDLQRPTNLPQASSLANSAKPEQRQPLTDGSCEEPRDKSLSAVGDAASCRVPKPHQSSSCHTSSECPEADSSNFRGGSAAAVSRSPLFHQVLQARLSGNDSSDPVPYASVPTARNSKSGEQMPASNMPFYRKPTNGSSLTTTPLYQNSPNVHFRSPSAPVDLPACYSNSARLGCAQPVAHETRGRSNSSSSQDALPEIAVADGDHEQDSSGYGGSSESVDHENLPVLPPRRSRGSLSPPRRRNPSERDSNVLVEGVSTSGCWRKSTADELFGAFSLQYIGSELVDKGYGTTVTTMEKVVQNARACQSCTMNVTAAAVQVFNEEGNPILRHEVDSIESLSPYGITSPSERALARLQLYLAYVVVREGIAAVCHVFKAANKSTRETVLKTIESALYADVKCYKSMTYPQFGVQRIKTRCSQFSVKYVGQILVQTTYRVIDEAARRLLKMTHPAKVGFAFMDISADRIRLSDVTTSAIFAAHQTTTIASLGAFSEDSRVFGYVIKQKRMGTKCHIFRCSRPSEALAVVDIIRDVCQESYCQQQQKHTTENEEADSGSSRGFLGFFARRRCAQAARRDRSVSAPPASKFWAGNKDGTAIARTGTGSVIHQATAITENDVAVASKLHQPPANESPYETSG